MNNNILHIVEHSEHLELLLGDGTSPVSHSSPNMGSTHLVFLRNQLSSPVISKINCTQYTNLS